MKKILIIKTSALGDVIHAYPTVAYLHQKFPHAQIDWVVEMPCAELVKAHPFVNQAIEISTKKWRKAFIKRETWKEICAFRKSLRETTYDMVLDLQGNSKSGLVLSQARSPIKIGFGKHSVPEWPNLFFTNHRIDPPPGYNVRLDYLNLARAFFGESSLAVEDANVQLKLSKTDKAHLQAILEKLKAFQNQPKVLVCSGSAWKNKQLTNETLGAFLALIQKDLNCFFLFAWGSKEEHETALKLQEQFAQNALVLDKLSLPLLQNMMGLSDLVVAMDSLPLHLAGTTSTPSFSVFGASSSAKYKPLGDQHSAFQGRCPYGRTFVKRCPILRTCPTGACIRDLEGKEIFAAFIAWWQTQTLSA